jgi:hypothetical protein
MVRVGHAPGADRLHLLPKVIELLVGVELSQSPIMWIFLQAAEGEVRELKSGSHERKGIDPRQEEEALRYTIVFGAA